MIIPTSQSHRNIFVYIHENGRHSVSIEDPSHKSHTICDFFISQETRFDYRPFDELLY